VGKALSRFLLMADVASRLGPQPVMLAAWARSPTAAWLAGQRLARWADPGATVAAPGLHGPFDPNADALRLDLFTPGDIRPVWERNRWAELPRFALAHRAAPDAGHELAAARFLAEWRAANPAYRGPNWACGQEAALRVLHLALAAALFDAKLPGAEIALRQHGQRIAATASYALAQDNNHPISEAAGLLICGLLLRDARWVRTGQARLERSLVRLIAPCGAFAQFSMGYHRLLLDVVSVTEWLRRRHGGPPLGAVAAERLAAATAWLDGLTDPASGATPRLGHQDGSCFADLAEAGPADARASVARATWLFGARARAPGAKVTTEGGRVWRSGAAWALLRTGPLRFRPGQADLLHLDLWDGPRNVLRDGGTGAYNPPPGHGWWHTHFTSTAAHNTIAFDDRDQMPRVGRFLFARWPTTGALPDGAWLRDYRRCRQARHVRVDGRRWIVEDVLEGPFRQAVLRWRLCPDAWVATAAGVTGAAARIAVTADAPIRVALESGWESPEYGVVVPCPVLVARADAPVSRIVTTIDLP